MSYTPAELRAEADALQKGEAWYYVDSPAFRRRYDTEHTQAMLRQAADDRETVDMCRHVMWFTCACGVEFDSLESFGEHVARHHTQPDPAREGQGD